MHHVDRHLDDRMQDHSHRMHDRMNDHAYRTFDTFYRGELRADDKFDKATSQQYVSQLRVDDNFDNVKTQNYASQLRTDDKFDKVTSQHYASDTRAAEQFTHAREKAYEAELRATAANQATKDQIFASGVQTARDFGKAQAELLATEKFLSNRSTDQFGVLHNQQTKNHGKTQVDILRSEAVLAKQANEHFIRIQQDLNRIENKGDVHYEKTSKHIVENKYQIELQAEKNLLAIQLEALKSKGELAAQISECCCDLKQKIAETSNQVIGVIESNQNADLRAKLQSAETKALVSELKCH